MAAASGTARFLGEAVSERELATIREVLDSYPGLSRMELAATVCELLGWKRWNGRPKARECREWLELLEETGRLTLPAKRKRRPLGSKTSIPPRSQSAGREEITGSAGELGPIRVERIRDKEGRLRFRELIGNYHYLGYRVPFGAQLQYLVLASRPEGEVLGCMQFSSAAWRMAGRDHWIGWDEETRKRNLSSVVCNSRFLILPWVRVKNLASTILSQAVRELAADWREAYGVEPLLAETLVDESRFSGTCYRAANWIELGKTTGRGRMDRERKREGACPKRIFVYPLRRDSRRRLLLEG